MTFIDNSAKKPTTFQIVLFGITAAIFLLCAFFAIHRTHTRRHYRRVLTVRLLFPLACILCALENVTLAFSGPFIDQKEDDHVILKFIFVVQALQVPIYLVTVFELTYLIHKRRSVQFCCMYFDEGRLGQRSMNGVFTTPVKSFFMRNIIRIVSIGCLLMGLIANFDLLKDAGQHDDLAGRTGWWKLWSKDDEWIGAVWTIHILLSLLPTVVLIFCSFVLSITLWRYGTTSSMVVHSSCFNPWCFLMFGTIALATGQLFFEKWYPVTSNVGLMVYTVMILVLMREIDRDILETAEFTEFLKQVASKGNMISVQNLASNDEDDPNDAEFTSPSRISTLRQGKKDEIV